MANIDLHIHSNCSADGEFLAEELLHLGQQAQLYDLSCGIENNSKDEKYQN